MEISVSERIGRFYTDIKESGFYGIDFSFDRFDVREKILSDEYTDYVMKKYSEIKDAGLFVCQTHLTYCSRPNLLNPLMEFDYKIFEEYMLPMLVKEIELTARMGCRTAVLHMYFEPDCELSRKGNVELLSKLLPVCEKYGVILSIENIYDVQKGVYCGIHLSTAEDLLYYVDYFKNPYLGICLDTGHAIILHQNPVEMLKAIGDKLTALHIHSTVPNMDLHACPNCVYYGERVDWDEFYNVLKDMDYDGTFNMELAVSEKLSDSAISTFYHFAYEVAKGIVLKNK